MADAGRRTPRAKQPRTHLLNMKATTLTKRTVLGTHTALTPMERKGNLDRRLLGEPRGFSATLSPGAIERQTTSGWNRVRMHNFKRRLHTRKARRVSIGGWRRSNKVLKPR